LRTFAKWSKQTLLTKRCFYQRNLTRKGNCALNQTVRKAIADLGGTMPEFLPTPQKSLKQLKKEKKAIIEP